MEAEAICFCISLTKYCLYERMSPFHGFTSLWLRAAKQTAKPSEEGKRETERKESDVLAEPDFFGALRDEAEIVTDQHHTTFERANGLTQTVDHFHSQVTERTHTRHGTTHHESERAWR